MLVLTNSGTDKLQVDTSSAANLDVHVSWVDVIVGTSATPGRTVTAISSAANDQDICATPSSGTQRVIKHINIRNRHASTACDVTVVYDANGTDYDLHKATVNAGETLEYQEGIGWFKIATAATADAKVFLTGDASAATTTTLADVTGLVLPVTSGVYYHFEFHMIYQAAATTTGIKCSVTIPSVTTFAAVAQLPVSTAADGTANIYYGHISSSGDAVVGTGTPAATTNTYAWIEGNILPSASGSVQLQYASEVAASNVTIKQGSSGILTRLST